MTNNIYHYFEKYEAALNREAKTVEGKMAAIKDRAAIVAEVDDAARRELGKAYDNNQKRGAFYKVRFRDHRSSSDTISERKTLDTIKREQTALLWLHHNPEQVAAVRAEYPNRLDVKSMQAGWNAIRKSLAKKQADGEISERELRDELLGDDVEAVKAAEADRRRKAGEKEKPQAEAVDLLTMDAKDLITGLAQRRDADSIAKALLHFIELEAQKAKPKPRKSTVKQKKLPDGTIEITGLNL